MIFRNILYMLRNTRHFVCLFEKLTKWATLCKIFYVGPVLYFEPVPIYQTGTAISRVRTTLRGDCVFMS